MIVLLHHICLAVVGIKVVPKKNKKVEIITQLCFYAAGVASFSGIQISSAVQETSDIVLSICRLHWGYENNRMSCTGTSANISHIEVIT